MVSGCPKRTRRFLIVVILGVPLLFLCLHSTSFTSSSDDETSVDTEDFELELVEAEPICYPSHNVFFFKTHKTGSSTLFNIFMRYADEKNLTVAVSREPSNLLRYPAILDANFLPDYALINRRVEIFAIHTRLDIQAAKKLMAPRTKFITILRDPVYSWSSGFNYFNLPAVTGMSLEDFLDDGYAIDKMKRRKFSPWFGFNFLFYDLGFNETLTAAPAAQAQRAIDMLERNFGHVMIAELMDESLILMQHALCWDLEDIIAFRHNERNSSIYPRDLEPKLIYKIADLNDIDVRIYNHFAEKLRGMIDEFGTERMAKEVGTLRLRRDRWLRECLGGYRHGFQNTLVFLPKDNASAKCLRLTRTELEYVMYFRELYMNELDRLQQSRE
ncbi:galactosylceramide sulfotransferase [Galendromus occidentalis]|uniref:Galactosylceramide sulfotransferase n=1 Tax=Galendromus occidentalis TaxID=34638 RepID=A0AAJ6W0W4_9ACAR|nr:galactosylceramide sulfotransferase [Galendromus occidentalis]